MAFKQHNKDPDRLWQTTKRAELLDAGVPDFLVDDVRRWTYVLLHGDDGLMSGWNPSWITKEQARALLGLLREHYAAMAGLCLLAALERRINRGDIEPKGTGG